MPDFDVCKFDGLPCFMFVSKDGERTCLIKNNQGRVLYACVRIRFKGRNSVWERGFGMTILEKLERQGLIKYIDEMNFKRLKKKCRGKTLE